MRKLFTLLFFVLICLPLIASLVHFDLQVPLFENRTLSPWPVFSFAQIKEYPKQFDSFFNDHFSFRTLLVSANSFLKIKLLKDSPSSDVVIGKEDWLFLISPQDYSAVLNAKPYSEDELKKIQRSLEAMADYFQGKGAKFYFMIAPDSHDIYPEFLPATFKKQSRQSQLDQLTAYLQKNQARINFINPTQALLQAKKTGQIYYRHNNHWNQQGALIGYQELMKPIGRDFPRIKPFETTDFSISYRQSDIKGLEGMMGVTDYFQEQEPVLTPKFAVTSKKDPENCLEITARCIDLVSTVDDATLPTAVVYRDSFFQALIPFFAEHFKQVHYIWKVSPLSTQPVIEEKPQIVIYEITERNMWTLTENLFDFK